MPLKSAEHIFAKYNKYLTKDMVSRVAVKLARSTYFGESVLEGSLIGGTEDTRSLDPHVMHKMKAALREKYPPVSPTEFGGNMSTPFRGCVLTSETRPKPTSYITSL